MRKYLTVSLLESCLAKYDHLKSVLLVAQRHDRMGDTYDCQLVAVRLEHPEASSVELHLRA